MSVSSWLAQLFCDTHGLRRKVDPTELPLQAEMYMRLWGLCDKSLAQNANDFTGQLADMTAIKCMQGKQRTTPKG